MEDSLMVAASRSQPWSAVWDDHAYGFFVPWAIVEVSTWFPLALAPPLLVGLTVVTWWCCALWIRQALHRSSTSGIGADLAPLALCAVPLPEIGYLGLVSSAGWPLAAAALATVAVAGELPRGPRAWVTPALIALVAASHPTGVVIAAVCLLRAISDRSRVRSHLARAAGAILGVFLSMAVAHVQDPPLAYLGPWNPVGAADEEVAERLAAGGALTTRGLGRLDPRALVEQIGGSVRFVATQFLPEPWASRALIATSQSAKLLQVAALVGAPVAFGVLHAWCLRRDGKTPSPSLLLVGAAVTAVIVQHVLVGRLTARQYLFLPLVLIWTSVLVTVTHVRSGRRASRATVVLLVAWFMWVVAQNFRDPFQENPRQGGTGRYAAVDLWRPALDRGRATCATRDADDVVVISQVNRDDPSVQRLMQTSGLGFAWFDHPVVLRCDVLGSDS
ncbi:MAG: hypothetical protein ACKORC_06040 [Acidimicrobiia bacterium]